jgi:radical SAM family uncharacterized protein
MVRDSREENPTDHPEVRGERGLWDLIEPLLSRVERPARYIDGEWGAHHDVASSYRVALLYPDTYEIGMANQGLAILYERLNAHEGITAERVYLPWVDMGDAMREKGVPLFALESSSAVADFDLLGVTLPYELTYTNVLEAFDLAGIPLRAADRDESTPLVIAGGPCVYNPEPVAPFFDAILIGEGEEAVIDIARAHQEARDRGLSRFETLVLLARVPGVYVPSLYAPSRDAAGGFAGMKPSAGAPPVVRKRVLGDLDAFRAPICPVVPFMDVVHDRVAVEVLRGCTRGCRFCQAGMVYRPVRERRADAVVRDVMAGLECTGYDEVSLTSLSTTDHSQLEEIVRRLSRRLEGTGVSVSLPSLRVDAFSVAMARIISRGRKSGLTFAPEAGTQRLRDVINKNVKEQDLLVTVRSAFENGWRRVKLYFMIGLPTETDEDIRGIGELVYRVLDTAREATPRDQRGSIRIGVSVSTFVPKAHTPFQFDGQIPLDEVTRRQSVLRENMPRKGVDLSWHDADVSFLEGVMARGGRELADVIEFAWRSGARFDAWTERFDLPTWHAAFDAAGVDAAGLAGRSFSPSDVLPWSHISPGVTLDYLWEERTRALQGLTTPDCSFGGCDECGVCSDLDVGIRLGGAARGTG